MTEQSVWAVSVPEVRALAAQLTPKIDHDPDYGPSLKTVGDEDIAYWVEEVTAVVDVKLRKRSRLSTANRARLMLAGKTVIKTAAAAYLVDAAAPTRAGLNDNASYGNVLWTRYQSELDSLIEQLSDWVKDGVDNGGPTRSGGSAQFQEPIITDELTW